MPLLCDGINGRNVTARNSLIGASLSYLSPLPSHALLPVIVKLALTCVAILARNQPAATWQCGNSLSLFWRGAWRIDIGVSLAPTASLAKQTILSAIPRISPSSTLKTYINGG